MEWIPVNDKLPEQYAEGMAYSKIVLGYNGENVYPVIFYIKDKIWYMAYSNFKNEVQEINVTHWMPFPKAPNK